MIGDVVYVGKQMYVVVNNAGAVEKLPHVGFWRQLYIEVRDKFRKWELAEIRRYCELHGTYV